MGEPLIEEITSHKVTLWQVTLSWKIHWLVWVVLPLIGAGIVWWHPWTIFGPHLPGTPARSQAWTAYTSLQVVPQRVTILGYERDCTAGKGCSFGPPWSDNTHDRLGHNGRDTRTDMLMASRDGDDPYTGKPLPSLRAQQHVDHIYPLAAAWDFGAWQWSAEKRTLFANDTSLNLVVVSGYVNVDKGDSTPAEWLPPWRGAHCWYAYRYMTVAIHYDLPVSQADRRALKRAIRTCPFQAVSG